MKTVVVAQAGTHLCVLPRLWRTRRHLGTVCVCTCGQAYVLRGVYDSLGDLAGGRWVPWN